MAYSAYAFERPDARNYSKYYTKTSIKKEQEGVRDVFVACGGSLTAFYASKYFLESESSKIRVGYYISNEFVHALPASLGKQ